jgi:hypothetical protein
MDDYYLEKSEKPKKKYMVSWINPKSGRVKTIHFGAKGMTDYILSKGDDERKQRYINRHQKREDWSDLEKAGTWALNILWGEKTLKKSIKEMEKKFNIKIWLIE